MIKCLAMLRRVALNLTGGDSHINCVIGRLVAQ